jgi:hypothetical protein
MTCVVKMECHVIFGKLATKTKTKKNPHFQPISINIDHHLKKPAMAEKPCYKEKSLPQRPWE